MTTTLLGILLVGLLTAAAPAEAAPTSLTVNKCLAGKITAAAQSLAVRVTCYARDAAQPAVAKLSACLAKADDGFDGGATAANGVFERLERKPPCLTYDDQTVFNGDITATAGFADLILFGSPNRCDAKMLRCVATFTRQLGKCYARAASRAPGTIDAACTQRALDKFQNTQQSGCFDKAVLANPGICSSPFSSSSLYDLVHGFIVDSACALDPVGCPAPTATPLATATPSPTATPTRTPTPMPTSTAPPICGNGSVEPGEYCDPPGVGQCGSAFTCTACTCTCPATMDFTIDAPHPDTRLDLGWLGLAHQMPVTSNGTVTVALAGCSGGATRPCGTCSVTGPILNAGADAGRLHNQRCTNDTAIKCTSDAPCLGGGGTCALFLGSSLPVSSGNFGTCFVSHFAGPLSGTANVDTGATTMSASVTTRVYNGASLHETCPRCVGDPIANDGTADGSCESGPRAGLACDANGEVPGLADFGAVSLDCPPPPASIVATLPIALGLTTDTIARTLTAASPGCSGAPGKKCFCSTCNNANQEPCFGNADCPMSGGNPGICGGLRCINGGNTGTPCSTSSVCPGGTCGRPGEQTKPNACVDDSGDTGFCIDAAPLGDGRGECLTTFPGAGPVDETCSNHPQRYCLSDFECDGVAGACGSSVGRRCFLDGGTVGGEILGLGHPDAPIADVSTPTLASIFCVGAVSPALNSTAGLPGPARLIMKATAVGRP